VYEDARECANARVRPKSSAHVHYILCAMAIGN
jgi:hypothetical protein